MLAKNGSWVIVDGRIFLVGMIAYNIQERQRLIRDLSTNKVIALRSDVSEVRRRCWSHDVMRLVLLSHSCRSITMYCMYHEFDILILIIIKTKLGFHECRQVETIIFLYERFKNGLCSSRKVATVLPYVSTPMLGLGFFLHLAKNSPLPPHGSSDQLDYSLPRSSSVWVFRSLSSIFWLVPIWV